jgi:hypothetical protein
MTTIQWRDPGDCARRVYSQYGEEGVLEGLFANIGVTNRCLIDIGAGDGIALSNTRLFLEQGWHGARFDVAYAADVHQERITAENICDVLAKYNVSYEPDLLSLDIDGVDWYVLRTLLRGGYHPRVICCEINGTLPEEPSVVIAYDPAHTFDETNYYGASLGAYRRLCEAHGYRLVWVHVAANAFFVAKELVPPTAVVEWEFVPAPHWPTDPRGRPWHRLSDEDLA